MLPVQIGYKTYTIDYIDNPMGDNHGICQNEKGKIFIDKNLPTSDLMNTTIHEILHAIFYSYGILTDEDEEEKIVVALANGITEVVLRNPELLRKLGKMTKEINNATEKNSRV